MKKLTKKQLDILVNTPYDQLLKVFKGITRRELIRIKKEELAKRKVTINEQVLKDREKRQTVSEKKEIEKKYKFLLDKIEKLEEEKSAILKITNPITVTKIKPAKKTINGDGVAVVVLSDWHYEETVLLESVNGLNEYNLRIANARILRLWQNTLRLVKNASRDNDIRTVVLALLGDFITGELHDELIETNSLLPMDAVFRVQQKLISGIQFLLDSTDKEFVVHCVAGNHSRITKLNRHSTFNGNSLEYLMYHNMALYFQNEPRVKFNIPAGYLSYMDILGITVRFHHGHGIRYHGGVGGIYIPANKAIAQWNKGRRADLDVMAHWHQLRDGGSFLINGSLIGYNAYAMNIKADFEKPAQLFFLINKYGRTGYTKIVV